MATKSTANHINDKFLINESNKGTKVMLEKGISIDTTCMIVKNYQKIYILMKQESPILAQQFTFVKYMEKVIDRKFKLKL